MHHRGVFWSLHTLLTSILVVLQAGHALNTLHSCGVLHRDIKPQNILLTSKGVLKINDFDLSCLKATAADRMVTVGTDAYRSPRLDGEDALYEEQDDWVALCLTFAELVVDPEDLDGDKVTALQSVLDLPTALGNLKTEIRKWLPNLIP